MTDAAKALADEAEEYFRQEYFGPKSEDLRKRIVAALRSPQPAPLATREEVVFPRWWVERIRDGLVAMGKLPTGPLGDWAFIFREQLTDALSLPTQAAPAQEPVAWTCEYQGNHDATVLKSRMEDWVRLGRKVTPCYATPPSAQADVLREDE